MKAVQETIAREQEAARIAAEERAKAEAAAKAEQEALAKAKAEAAKPAEPVAKNTAPESKPDTKPAQGGKEFYVTATAYTADPSENGYKPGETVKSKLGHNLTANPNMKLIAVDPAVIPLGSTVYVEGYGTAIAGDTGSAIKGHIIDLLMPDSATANNWGRRTVKVTILN